MTADISGPRRSGAPRPHQAGGSGARQPRCPPRWCLVYVDGPCGPLDDLRWQLMRSALIVAPIIADPAVVTVEDCPSVDPGVAQPSLVGRGADPRNVGGSSAPL